MPYNFGLVNFGAFSKAKQWLKGGNSYSNGKPPFDVAEDNNYQNYADNPGGTGAIPTYKPCNTNGQFEVTAGHLLADSAFTINAVAVPATPTAVVNGTAGATTYTYKVVGRAGNLSAPSATVSKTTGNATLSAVNSITITFVPTPGFAIYDIYRTASGGTPSSTGRIGWVNQGFGPNVSTPTLTFTDTGLVADGSTAPTVNTTGAIIGDVNVYGNIAAVALATPATPIATVVGTAGATTISYKIVARSGSYTTATGHTAASAAVTVTTANATLSATNYINLVWQPVVGAVSYDVYRTATNGTAPTTTGLIGNTISANGFQDTGLAGDSSTAPATNNTGTFGAGSGSTVTGPINYIATETGANNAIAGALAGVTLQAGLEVSVKLAHTLQAGANTFNLNAGGAVAIKSHYNIANNIATVYAATGVITMIYDGTEWLDMAQ